MNEFTIFRIQIYSTRSVSVLVHLKTDRADLNSLIFFKCLLVVPFLIYRIRIIGYNLFDIKYRLVFESQKRDKTIIRILFKNLFRLAVRMCVSTCSHHFCQCFIISVIRCSLVCLCDVCVVLGVSMGL